MFDLIIIGGGPAGVTAGIYAERKKLKTLIIAKDFFGQISKTGQVDNWPGDMAISGMALAMKLEKHLKSFPLEIKQGQKVVAVQKGVLEGTRRGSDLQETELKSFGRSDPLLVPLAPFTVQIEDGEIFEAKALIIATGRNARNLDLDVEENFVGHGLSYCSICDAPFFKNKQVAVIGGGNAGFETAMDLAKYAKQVFLFEKNNKILADQALVEDVKKIEKIQVCLQTEILKIEGNGKVESIVYKDLVSGKIMQQPMEGVFVQIGSIPATAFLGDLAEFNDQNEIKVNSKTLETSVKGIFAAGDCNDTKWKQAIIASGQGAVAALSAYEFLQKEIKEGRPPQN